MPDFDPNKPKPGSIVLKDTLPAPIIYFDGVPNYGFTSGIVNVTLCAARFLASGDGVGVSTDVLAVAHLRCNVQAAEALRKAIEDAILIAAPAAGGGQSN